MMALRTFSFKLKHEEMALEWKSLLSDLLQAYYFMNGEGELPSLRSIYKSSGIMMD